MKRAYYFFLMFMLCDLGSCIGRILHVLSDKKQHPEMYSPPYPSWFERVDVSVIISVVVAVVCIAAMIILKILMRKNEKKDEQQEAAAE